MNVPHVVTATVPALPTPPAELFGAAPQAELTRAAHDGLALDLLAFNALEVRAAPRRVPDTGTLRVAAWNAERLKHAAPSADLVRAVGPDVLLLSEADIGMARSGNRHTVADLAAALDMGYAYGVEFLELGIGDERESEWHRGERNDVGFHGNAVLSRLPFSNVALIRLDDGAVWWIDAREGQRRLGFRMAVAPRSKPVPARCLPFPFTSRASRTQPTVPRRYAGSSKRWTDSIQALRRSSAAI
ncbi:endonuclease/exonuclease/phosphatase family protein [Kaistia algarum]|uniref:hypothetical protein n=1 Tax=Kaistia algarum TaxID=2083279 RepID=UPI0010573C1B|nr:hypothetical protein [Kaistia algarum]MCX5513603.1 hypothetical protein [Kaistia algarum]